MEGALKNDIWVSIIIPIYNVERYLEKCIRSVQAQTYENIEIILVNDGSIDRCPEICDRYASVDYRIKVIHKENGGLSSARNAGLEVATGKYVYFLDSDDYIEAELIEEAVRCMEENDSDWLGFWVLKEDFQGIPICQIAFKERTEKIELEEERFKFMLNDFLNYKVGWEVCFHVFRNDIIKKNNLRFVSERNVFAEDLLFSFCYMLYANSYTIIPKVFYHYVQRADSLLGKQKEKNILPQLCVLLKEMRKNVEIANFEKIKQKFPYICMELLEWHTRGYIKNKGIIWVKKELFKLKLKNRLTLNKRKIGTLYKEGIQEYGNICGVVSIIVSWKSPKEKKLLKQYLKKMQEQTLQRFQIIVLNETSDKMKCKDVRVAFKTVKEANWKQCIKVAIEECVGEYVYFGNLENMPEDTFLDELSAVMKYNGCSTGFLSREMDTKFYSRYNMQDGIELRKYIRETKDLLSNMIITKDILKEDMLPEVSSMKDYFERIVLDEHAIIFCDL